MLNGDNYTANGNYCSVREYYRLMSTGKLDYQNVVVGPITHSQKRDYYIGVLLAKEALNQVVRMGIDLAQFDSKNEGILDAVSFLYAGEAVYEDNVTELAWLPDGTRVLAGYGVSIDDKRWLVWLVEKELLTARLTERVCNIMTDDAIRREIPAWRGCEVALASVADDLARYNGLVGKE